TCYIQQESTFWRRSLWQRTGGRLDTKYRMAGDFDLWARFFEQAELYSVDVPIGCFRRHDDQRTSTSFANYLEEAKAIFARSGGRARSGLIQGARIVLRQSATANLRSWTTVRRLLGRAPTVTYDWGSQEWVLQ